MTEEQLKHFGILGMHWGRKKGKTRVYSHKDHSIKARKKDIRELSNDELKTLTSRFQLEKSYSDISKKEVSRGKQSVLNFMENFAKQQVDNILSSLVKKGMAFVGI